MRDERENTRLSFGEFLCGHFCSGGFLALFSSSSFVWEGTDEVSMNSSWGSSMFSFSRLGRSSGAFSRLMVCLQSKPKCICLPSFCTEELFSSLAIYQNDNKTHR